MLSKPSFIMFLLCLIFFSTSWVKFVLGVFLCVTISSCNELFCTFKFVVMNVCISLSFVAGCNIFLPAPHVYESYSVDILSFFLRVTFPRVFNFFFLKWLLSSIMILFLFYFVSVSPISFLHTFSQCNISSIMKVQLIT